MKLKVNQYGVGKLAIGLAGFFLITIILTTIFSLLTFNLLKAQEFQRASQSAKWGRVFLFPLKIATFNKPTDIQLADNFFNATTDLPKVVDSLSVLDQTQNDRYLLDFDSINKTLELPFFNSLENINSLLRKPSLTKNIIGQDSINTLLQVEDLLTDLKSILPYLSSEQQKWLLVFQNSNELRPTGGFMGSYAIVDINEGKIVDIVVEDIFDADGQFDGYIPAPPGVYEYLSGGKGMRLPDSNWHPDTAKSAQEVLKYFAFGNRQNIKGVIFVNLDFAKTLLEATGPINLNDYNTLVTADNIDDVLRSQRDEFFPGSTQKKHIISQLLTQAQLELQNLEAQDKIQLLGSILADINKYDLQLYSTVPKIDEVFLKYNLRQELMTINNADYLYLIEANVGINKANKKVKRNVYFEKEDGLTTVTINFENNNSKMGSTKIAQLIEKENLSNWLDQSTDSRETNHLAYVNYQRIFYNPEWSISRIYTKTEVGEENEIEEWVEQQILDNLGNSINEASFLVVVPESSKLTVVIEFSTLTQNDQIYIQKQPGIAPVLYTLTTSGGSKAVEVENNTLIDY
jgi:hypothetical protein